MLYLHQNRAADGGRSGHGFKWWHSLPRRNAILNLRIYWLSVVEIQQVISTVNCHLSTVISKLSTVIRQLQCPHINHKPVLHITVFHSYIRFIDVLNVDEFNIRNNIVFGAIVEHFLCFRQTTD